MKKLLFCLLFANFAFAKIETIYSFQEIEDILQTADKSTLVIFDIGNVLTTYEDMILRPAGKTFLEEKMKNFHPLKRKQLHSIILAKAKQRVVERSISSLIQNLQKKNIKTIALTNCRTGDFETIKNVEDWRIKKLLNFNIDFSCSFPEISKIIFKELTPLNNSYPLFKNGILFSSINSKGIVLKTFLYKINFHPHKVIFIEDNINNILSVASELKKINIDFLGYHYKGAISLSTSFDKKIAEIQLKHLEEKTQWLSDREATLLLQ